MGYNDYDIHAFEYFTRSSVSLHARHVRSEMFYI